MKPSVRGVSRLGLLIMLVMSIGILGCDNPANADNDGGGTAGGDGSTSSEAVNLTLGQWYTGTTKETRVWYAVGVTGGSTYRINWDDSDVTSSYADIVVDAFHEDGITDYFTDRDWGPSDSDGTYYTDVTIPAGESSLFVVADGDYYGDSGDYRLKVTEMGGGDGGGDSASLTLSSTSVSLSVGATQEVSATALDPDGNSESVTAGSSDTSVASVSVSGSTITISGVAAGAATVTVTSASSETADIAVTVTSGETSVVQIGSWSQLGTSAIATIGGSSTYNPPELDFDTDGNPYVGYVDEATKDIGVKRSTDGSSWSQLGGGLADPFGGLWDSMSPSMAVVGSAATGRVNVKSSSMSYQNLYSIDLLSSASWTGPYGDAFNSDTDDYGSWYEGSAEAALQSYAGSVYLAYDTGSSTDMEVLTNDGSDTELSVSLASTSSGVGWNRYFVMDDLSNMAVGDYLWNSDGIAELTIYTGGTSGLTEVDTTTPNSIATADGILALHLAYNPANGNLGVVFSDDGGETVLYEWDGSSWTKIGPSIIAAADATNYSWVRLAYQSDGTPYVVIGTRYGIWTGGYRYDSSGDSWEELADAPNSTTKIADVGMAGDVLHVLGATDVGETYEAQVWTFSEAN